MKKYKYLKKVLLIIILVIALSISLNLNRNLTKLETSIKELLLPMNKLFTSKKDSSCEQQDSYIIQKNLNITLEQEIEELKELLSIQNIHTEYEKENATVISRNNQNWLNTITIDKGSSSGIEKENAVITSKGLIGKVIKVTPKSSEIKLLTANDIKYKTSVTIRVNNQDHYAILNGYDKDNNVLKVTAIDKNLSTQVNDIVLTSGLGNMPKGIYIGKVISSEIDNYDLSKTLYIKTEQDFNSINYVTVLKEKIN